MFDKILTSIKRILGKEHVEQEEQQAVEPQPVYNDWLTKLDEHILKTYPPSHKDFLKVREKLKRLFEAGKVELPPYFMIDKNGNLRRRLEQAKKEKKTRYHGGRTHPVKVCPFCGEEIGTHNYSRHTNVCKFKHMTRPGVIDKPKEPVKIPDRNADKIRLL